MAGREEWPGAGVSGVDGVGLWPDDPRAGLPGWVDPLGVEREAEERERVARSWRDWNFDGIDIGGEWPSPDLGPAGDALGRGADALARNMQGWLGDTAGALQEAVQAAGDVLGGIGAAAGAVVEAGGDMLGALGGALDGDALSALGEGLGAILEVIGAILGGLSSN